MEKNTGSLFRKFLHYLPLGCFMVAILCLCFSYGVVVGKWHLFPYRFLNIGWNSLKEFRHKPARHFIHPARYEGEGVVVYECEKVYPGVTLLTGIWKDEDDWHVGIRLIDLNGKVLHEWRCNPRDIWAHSPHNDCRAGSSDHKSETYVHGAWLLPDGDVVFNLEHFSLVRLNAHSHVVWKLPYRTHHSVFQDDEGNFWACGIKWHEEPVPEFPGLKPPFVDNTIIKVSQDGVIEREISLLEIMYRSGYNGLFFNNRSSNTGEILHLNDVEVLSKRKADAFDIFQAGDIMVSMRHINAVFVIDGQTELIKWSLYPFIAQHDPDFTDNGYITVFDNYLEDFGGSRILRIEPSTKEVAVLYGQKRNQYFFTFRCGKHQHLPNGNMLITESEAGRVFEITPKGKVVWSWIVPRWDKNSVPEILEGTRYGMEFTDFINRENKK